MPARRKSGEAAAPAMVSLPPILDLRSAAPLAASFRAVRGQAVGIDAASVDRLGGQCLQVLLSAALSWRSDKRTLTVTGASDAFLADLATFGLQLGAIEARGA